MRDHKVPSNILNDLNRLNQAMLQLAPSITGIDSSMLAVTGSTLAMLNAEIAANPLTLYNGIKRADVINAIKPGLTLRVNTHPIGFAYDVHGDKHFPGGPDGTKFVTAGLGAGAKAIINLFLQNMINPLRGRIRRDAKGKNQTYYLTEPPNQYTGARDQVIQIDYIASPESIGFHGYPDDNVAVYSLSRTKGGLAIPL